MSPCSDELAFNMAYTLKLEAEGSEEVRGTCPRTCASLGVEEGMAQHCHKVSLLSGPCTSELASFPSSARACCDCGESSRADAARGGEGILCGVVAESPPGPWEVTKTSHLGDIYFSSDLTLGSLARVKWTWIAPDLFL